MTIEDTERWADEAHAELGILRSVPMEEQPLASAREPVVRVTCRRCGWECENKAGYWKHMGRHNFVARLQWNVFTCWFCSAWMVEHGAPWSIPERIKHIVQCYERRLAGGDPMAEALERRREMSFAR